MDAPPQGDQDIQPPVDTTSSTGSDLVDDEEMEFAQVDASFDWLAERPKQPEGLGGQQGLQAVIAKKRQQDYQMRLKRDGLGDEDGLFNTLKDAARRKSGRQSEDVLDDNFQVQPLLEAAVPKRNKKADALEDSIVKSVARQLP